MINWSELVQVVNQLTRDCVCPNCKSKYKTDAVYVLGQIAGQVFFQLQCESCGVLSFVNVMKSKIEQARVISDLTSSEKKLLNTLKPISAKDGENMAKLFKGNNLTISKLFDDKDILA